MSAASHLYDEAISGGLSTLEMMSSTINTTNTTNTTMTSVPPPQWAVDLQKFRKEKFLRYIEPIILFLIGPMEEEFSDAFTTTTVRTHATTSVLDIDLESTVDLDMGDLLNETITHGRRLDSILPSYAVDVTAFRETSMSFLTLVMLFTIMSCVLIVFLSCFYHNQKTSPLFISPRRHRLPKLVPPPLPVDGTFSWIKVCFYMSDEEIINRIGFDSLIFLRFHRLALRCIVKMSVFSFIVLLPLNFTGGGHLNAQDLKGYVGSLLFTDFLRFTMANVTGGSPKLWVHCFATYLLTAIVMRELVVEYNAFNNIRHRYMLCKEPHLRTVLVTNIPRHLRSHRKIRNYFKHVYPEAVKNVTICQNLIELEKLVLKRNGVLSRIEKELLILCRNEKRKLVGKSSFESCRPANCCVDAGIMGAAQERLAGLYSDLETLNDCIEKEQKRRRRVMSRLDRMDAVVGRKDIDYLLATPFMDDHRGGKKGGSSKIVFGNSAGSSTSDGKRGSDRFRYSVHPGDPAHNPNSGRTRPFARAKQSIKRYSRSVFDVNLFGKSSRVPIDSESVARRNSGKSHTTDEENEAIENHTNEVSDKAFIEMKTFTSSTIAIQSMHSSKPGAMEVTTAPEPRDVLWQNVYVTKGAKRTRGYIAGVLVIAIVTLYIIPVALVSLLVSESALISFSPRLAQLDQASAFFASSIALVQPITLTVIQQLLPPLFIQISKAEGLICFSEVQMKAFSRYFMFQVLNVFLVTAIAGSIFDTLAIILENPESAFEMLGNSLPRMSSFFITLVTMKSFLGLGVELVRTLSIVQSGLRYILFPNSTLRQKRLVRLGMRAIDDPGWFPFHKILAQDMLVVVISVVFAVVAPIVLLPCAVFCLFSRIMWTHHHLYVYESVFESGGQFWPKIFRRFVFGLIVAQMTITGQFILKEARHEAYATMALMFMTYYFLRNTRARFDAASSTLPLEVATMMDITVAQERESRAAKRPERSSPPNGIVRMASADTMDGAFDESRELDPFLNAYRQPALRANPRARPEQPFPPGQLGREDVIMNRNGERPSTANSSGVSFDDKPGNSKATVRLKSLNQRDRNMVDHWWAQQFTASGEQNFASVLVGEEGGTLRLGTKSGDDDPADPEYNRNMNIV